MHRFFFIRFCHLHGDSQVERPEIPPDLIDLPKQVLPQLVMCLYEKTKHHMESEKAATGTRYVDMSIFNF